MTSGQRKMHVVVWLVLGPIVVVGLVLAVSNRPSVPWHHGELPGVMDQVERELPFEDGGTEG